MTMKLAEALQERTSLNSKLEQLSSTISDNVLYQEGDTPDLDIKELLKEHTEAAERLCWLMTRINLTNSTIKADNGKTMTELLATRDTLKLQVETYQNIRLTLGSRISRASRSEIKIIAAISAADIKKMIDDTSKELRTLDNKIQALNWKADLIE